MAKIITEEDQGIRRQSSSLSVDAEALLSQEPDLSQQARETVLMFFTEGVRRFQQQLDQLRDRLVGPGLVDLDLRVEFAQACHAVLAQGEQAVEGLEKKTQERVKAAFREAMKPWTQQNPFIQRCLEKPRGYAGDFLMMEGGYINTPELTGGLAGAFDRFFLDTYECVRQRKDLLRSYIKRYLSAEGGSTLRMLSLGSGPCREWADVELQWHSGRLPSTIRKAQLTCLDFDAEALTFGQKRLVGHPLIESVEFIQTDLFGFTKAQRWRDELASYDLISGLGIANYFYDTVLENIIAGAFTLVKPGGELMITHKGRDEFNFVVADWFCDWVFLKRSDEEFTALFHRALAEFDGAYEFRLEWESCREIMFGIAKRK